MRMIILIGLLVLVAACTGPSGKELQPLVDCLKEKEVEMYGSITCSHCLQQKKMFEGTTFEEIECHPQAENSQTELCIEKEIRRTPTWTQDKDGVEVKRTEGVMSAEELAEFAGCEI